MPKGKYGIPLPLYGIAAFLLVIFNQTIILLMLSLFVVLGEKDDQTSRTVLEAMALQFTANLFYLLLSLVTMLGVWIPFIGLAVASILGVATLVVSLVASGIAILGIIKAAKDEELNFPILKDFANSLLMFINRF